MWCLLCLQNISGYHCMTECLSSNLKPKACTTQGNFLCFDWVIYISISLICLACNNTVLQWSSRSVCGWKPFWLNFHISSAPPAGLWVSTIYRFYSWEFPSLMQARCKQLTNRWCYHKGSRITFWLLSTLTYNLFQHQLLIAWCITSYLWVKWISYPT